MNKRIKEKLEWIGKELSKRSFFLGKMCWLSCGELGCCNTEWIQQNVCYVFKNEFDPVVEKTNLKVTKKDNMLVPTLSFEQQYKMSTNKHMVVDKYIKYQEKNLLMFLNILYGRNHRNLNSYDVKQMLEDDILFGFIRQEPYALPTKDNKHILIFEEVGMIFGGEPYENQQYLRKTVTARIKL